MNKSNTFNSFLILLSLVLFLCGCSNDKPDAKFKVSAETTQVGDSIIFTNQSSNADFYQWSFGDGAFAITKDTKHAYSKSGTYSVKMVAIGNDKSSEVTVSINITGEVKIFAGKGISEINIYDTWEKINNKYANEDTVHKVNYTAPYYYHTVYYNKIGFAVMFINLSEVDLDPTDEAGLIYVYNPYKGYTAKGITFGSSVDQVKTAYGTPGIYNGSDYKVYYYDNIGIEFFASNTSNKVGIIAIYEASSKKSGSLFAEKSKMIFKNIPVGK